MTDYSNLNQEYEMTSQAEYGRADNFEKLRNRRRTNYSRSGNRPAAFNGIHRRRRKRVSW